MPRPSARRGAFFAGLLALVPASLAPGCLFAPDPCTDLLQCTGAGGAGTTGDATTDGATTTTTTGSGGHTPCATDAACLGGPTPTCDPATKTCRDCSIEDCRAPLGGSCAEDAACVTGRCLDAICVSCTADAQCPSQICGAPACKVPIGSPCGKTSECVDGECRFGICKVNIAHACDLASDCFTGVCSMGTCQACNSDDDCPGTGCGTGSELGRCLAPPGASCWPDSLMIVSCFSGTCQGFPAKCQ